MQREMQWDQGVPGQKQYFLPPNFGPKMVPFCEQMSPDRLSMLDFPTRLLYHLGEKPKNLPPMTTFATNCHLWLQSLHWHQWQTFRQGESSYHIIGHTFPALKYQKVTRSAKKYQKELSRHGNPSPVIVRTLLQFPTTVQSVNFTPWFSWLPSATLISSPILQYNLCICSWLH